MAKYKVLAARDEEISAGFIWLTACPEFETGHSVLKLKNKDTGASISVEIKKIDSNFIKNYNAKETTTNIVEGNNYLIIPEWYRKKLKINSTKLEVELEIKSHCFEFIGEYCASLSYPQVNVRQSSLLGLIGLVLGIAGFILGIVPLLRNC